jgi:hypothetical protein
MPESMSVGLDGYSIASRASNECELLHLTMGFSRGARGAKRRGRRRLQRLVRPHTHHGRNTASFCPARSCATQRHYFFGCHGKRPSSSTCNAVLRNVLISTISPKINTPVSVGSTPTCSGLQSSPARLANKGLDGPALYANMPICGPALCANEPTLVCKRLANPLAGQPSLRMASSP